MTFCSQRSLVTNERRRGSLAVANARISLSNMKRQMALHRIRDQRIEQLLGLIGWMKTRDRWNNKMEVIEQFDSSSLSLPVNPDERLSLMRPRQEPGSVTLLSQVVETIMMVLNDFVSRLYRDLKFSFAFFLVGVHIFCHGTFHFMSIL